MPRPRGRHRGTARAVALLWAVLLAVLLPATGALGQGGEAVRGKFVSGTGTEREPVEGIVLTVRDEGGDEIGTATTDGEGDWEVPLPGPGTYEVEVDEATLPDGVEFRDTVTNPQTGIEVNPGQARGVLFALGEAGARQTIADRFVGTTVQGLQFGLIIAITAIGLSLIFGTTGLVNFAHGELVAFGAVVTWFFNSPDAGVSWVAAAGMALFMAPVGLIVMDRLAAGRPTRTTGPSATSLLWLGLGWATFTIALAVVPAGLQLIPAGILGILFTAAMGAGFDRGLWRPLRQRRTGLITMLVVSIGLSIVLRNALQAWFGGSSRPYVDYTVQRAVDVGPFSLTPKEGAIIVIALVVLVGIALMLSHTRIGTAMRAVADNRDLAESSGIDVQKVILFVWVLGGGLAGLGGVLSAVDENVSFLLGFRLLLLMFAGVILGGLGTAYGALVGSLVVGLLTEWSTLFFSAELKTTWGLGVLILILLVRPQGLLGTKERFG